MEVKNLKFCENEDLVRNSNYVIMKANDLRKNSNNNLVPNKNEVSNNLELLKLNKISKLNIKEQSELIGKEKLDNNNDNINIFSVEIEKQNLIKKKNHYRNQ